MLNCKDCYLGIELGSTRIKCCLINADGKAVASGIYNWENSFVNNLWTYDLNNAIYGVGQCYLDLKRKIEMSFGEKITALGGIGISAMMHGLIALDEHNRLLTPFRTWRNNNTEAAAQELSQALNFNVPARWSISHVYHAVKNHEEFVDKLARVTTLAGYVNEKLTAVRGIGKDDASGMFPIDQNGRYNPNFLKITDELIRQNGYCLKVEKLLPEVLDCGKIVGTLTPEGALLLDPEGDLTPGIPFVAPEGDAATGFVATNSIRPNDGNVSAGTSVFGSFVLEKPLTKSYPEIDEVVTPDGKNVAMIHCNNCTCGLNECVALVDETLKSFGVWKEEKDIFSTLLNLALEKNANCNHAVFYNYLSGENITSVKDGAMLLAHSSDAKLSLADIVLSAIFSSFATFSVGMKILRQEGIRLNNVCVHGGIFKTKGVTQKIFASVLETPLSLNEEASEGGPFGMALLALYSKYSNTYSLSDFLNTIVFKNQKLTVETPDPEISQKYRQFEKTFLACLEGEKLIGRELKIC